MDSITGFSPIADKQAEILILGSMPSAVSLSQQQYYAHPRNAFWPIMLSLLSCKDSHYNQRKNCLIKNKIAVWDVLQSCHRPGSLDTAIKMKSISTNDFNCFFTSHPTIKKVVFNGTKAESIYFKHVLPTLNDKFKHLDYVRLPSTSPAHAAINLQQKLEIWKKEIKDDRL